MGSQKNKKQKMKVLCLLAIVAVASAEIFVVDVSEDVANAEGTGPSDRTIICNFFGQSRCTTACWTILLRCLHLGLWLRKNRISFVLRCRLNNLCHHCCSCLKLCHWSIYL